jgi:hypothetical protein
MACRPVTALPETENAERTPAGSDPHSYYCAECRTHYDFPWGRASDCTCARIQAFVAAHRESHETSPTGPTCKESSENLTDGLRTYITSLLDEIYFPNEAGCGNTRLEPSQLSVTAADTIIREMGLHQEWGALDDNDEGVLSDTREDLKPWGTETIKSRWITEWQVVS